MSDHNLGVAAQRRLQRKSSESALGRGDNDDGNPSFGAPLSMMSPVSASAALAAAPAHASDDAAAQRRRATQGGLTVGRTSLPQQQRSSNSHNTSNAAALAAAGAASSGPSRSNNADGANGGSVSFRKRSRQTSMHGVGAMSSPAMGGGIPIGGGSFAAPGGGDGSGAAPVGLPRRGSVVNNNRYASGRKTAAAAGGKPSHSHTTDQLSESELNEMRATFRNFDADNSGTIDVGELRLIMQHLGHNISEQDSAVLLQQVSNDPSRDGLVFEELVNLLMLFKETAQYKLLENDSGGGGGVQDASTMGTAFNFSSSTSRTFLPPSSPGGDGDGGFTDGGFLLPNPLAGMPHDVSGSGGVAAANNNSTGSGSGAGGAKSGGSGNEGARGISRENSGGLGLSGSAASGQHRGGGSAGAGAGSGSASGDASGNNTLLPNRTLSGSAGSTLAGAGSQQTPSGRLNEEQQSCCCPDKQSWWWRRVVPALLRARPTDSFPVTAWHLVMQLWAAYLWFVPLLTDIDLSADFLHEVVESTVVPTAIATAFLIIDIVVSLFLVDSPDVELYEWSVNKNYLHVWLWLDIVCVIPWEWVLLPRWVSTDIPQEVTRAFMHIKLLKLVSAAANYHTPSHAVHSSRVYIFVHAFFVPVFSSSVLFICFVHLLAVIWTSVSDTNYTVAMLFAAYTVSGVGYGLPGLVTTTAQRLLASAYCLIAPINVSIVVGSTITLLSQSNVDISNRHGVVETLRICEMSKYNKAVTADMLGYRDHLNAISVGASHGSVMAALPDALKRNITLFVKSRLIQQSAIFHMAHRTTQVALAQSLEDIVLRPGQVLCYVQETVSDMYMISHGKIAMIDDDGEIVEFIYGGGVVNDIGLVRGRVRQSKTARAVTHCDVFVLTSRAFAVVCRKFPVFGKAVLEVRKHLKHVEQLKRRYEQQQARRMKRMSQQGNGSNNNSAVQHTKHQHHHHHGAVPASGIVTGAAAVGGGAGGAGSRTFATTTTTKVSWRDAPTLWQQQQQPQPPPKEQEQQQSPQVRVGQHDDDDDDGNNHNGRHSPVDGSATRSKLRSSSGNLTAAPAADDGSSAPAAAAAAAAAPPPLAPLGVSSAPRTEAAPAAAGVAPSAAVAAAAAVGSAGFVGNVYVTQMLAALGRNHNISFVVLPDKASKRAGGSNSNNNATAVSSGGVVHRGSTASDGGGLSSSNTAHSDTASTATFDGSYSASGTSVLSSGGGGGRVVASPASGSGTNGFGTIHAAAAAAASSSSTINALQSQRGGSSTNSNNTDGLRQPSSLRSTDTANNNNNNNQSSGVHDAGKGRFAHLEQDEMFGGGHVIENSDSDDDDDDGSSSGSGSSDTDGDGNDGGGGSLYADDTEYTERQAIAQLLVETDEDEDVLELTEIVGSGIHTTGAEKQELQACEKELTRVERLLYHLEKRIHAMGIAAPGGTGIGVSGRGVVGAFGSQQTLLTVPSGRSAASARSSLRSHLAAGDIQAPFDEDEDANAGGDLANPEGLTS